MFFFSNNNSKNILIECEQYIVTTKRKRGESETEVHVVTNSHE